MILVLVLERNSQGVKGYADRTGSIGVNKRRKTSDELGLVTIMDQALDLMRRMPPVNVEQNLGALLDLAPELTEELLSRVDQPLQV